MSKTKFSIIQRNKECYKCKKTYGLELHHCLFGVANRKKADEDGLVVYLCNEHHRGTYGVHGKEGHEFDLFIKQMAQARWMYFYNKTTEQWIKRYGRNYL
jgi:hypothetical protein